MRIALVRDVSPSLERCELTHQPRVPIDLHKAREQHQAYVEALEALQCRVEPLPLLPDNPDAVFVEDTAVVLDEVAVVARPGAESRRVEVDSTAKALARYRQLAYIETPGTLDGGDVLRIGKTLYVGVSARSNAAGVGQLRAAVTPFGYRVEAVPLRGCLHLKTAATLAGPELLLFNPNWVQGHMFHGVQRLEVDPAEPQAANAVWLEAGTIYPASCPRTRERLERQGVWVHTVDMSETEKAEGGVTCCSIVFNA